MQPTTVCTSAVNMKDHCKQLLLSCQDEKHGIHNGIAFRAYLIDFSG